MGLLLKIIAKKMVHLNCKKDKTDEEQKEYNAMLAKKGISNDELNSIIASLGKNGTKKLFTGKIDLFENEENNDPWYVIVVFLAFLLILYYQKKDKA